MTPKRLIPCLLATMLASLPYAVPAQQSASGASATSQSAQAGAKTFSQQDLDQLLAPIALYPDNVLAQMLMASTYPLEIVQAARWVKANPKVSGKALEDAMQGQSWDPSVKAMAAMPDVLKRMNEQLEWTQKLGDAFLAQQEDVMSTVQSLRAKAHAQGNLKSSEQQTVKSESQNNQTVYIIESPKPDTVYVPTYNPEFIYGNWWYSAPPYYMYPPGYAYPGYGGAAFFTGMVVGAAIWGNCNWGGGNVDIDINKYNNFNRTKNTNKNWSHDAGHRGGVAYSDKRTADKFGRGSNSQASQARESFRGRTDSGGNLSAGDRAGDRGGDVGGGDRGGVSDRSAGGVSDRSAGGGRDSGFSGVGGSGASTRDASARGSSSRGGMSGGGFSGGGRAGGGGGRRR